MKNFFRKIYNNTMNSEEKATDEIENDVIESEITENEDPQITEIEPIEVELTETEKLTAEVSELKDKYLRLYADFENFRRRTAKEKIETVSYANGELIKIILPTLDDFERGMASMDTTTEIEPLKEGIALVYSKLFKSLESKGLKPMIAKGEVFDADLHESITQFAAPTDDLKGKVIEEIEKGYLLNNKVIRYAKVVVGS
jgi:molecular chaperone GrpE